MVPRRSAFISGFVMSDALNITFQNFQRVARRGYELAQGT